MWQVTLLRCSPQEAVAGALSCQAPAMPAAGWAVATASGARLIGEGAVLWAGAARRAAGFGARWLRRVGWGHKLPLTHLAQAVAERADTAGVLQLQLQGGAPCRGWRLCCACRAHGICHLSRCVGTGLHGGGGQPGWALAGAGVHFSFGGFRHHARRGQKLQTKLGADSNLPPVMHHPECHLSVRLRFLRLAVAAALQRKLP